ncbi:MAG: M6 family metalloprotease domain-containing protein [Candidatus Eisenbacteria bacterium]|uniref:M6 family metalloprotease domain-containing protein n=1 Tax=Eiseniibacteriota bacterium TaxID=2212470 RepID=A0A9D6L5D8_UNCEI|nr:M6 family metalloprotease domain-containing protein [Candidatus Eisenbacteria bacterium]MBI3538921.1 M6 family metalloprotease domain-containing protein [Candidatus Eisenbacteria bacterium]
MHNASRVPPLRALLALGGLLVSATPALATMPPYRGAMPPALAQAFADGMFRIRGNPDGLHTSTVQTVWNIPVILAGFADQPISSTIYGGRTPQEFFSTTLFDTTGSTATGSVFDYYRWVSANRIRVVGKVVATVQLPQTKAYYARENWGLPSGPTDQSIYGFVSAALSNADNQVDWTQFDLNHDGYVDMVWVIHSGLPGENTVATDNDLWSSTWRLSDWTGGNFYETHSTVPGAPTVKIKVDRFSVVPEFSGLRVLPQKPCEIGVFAHEFGHALGLPDLYDTSIFGGARNLGPGNWNLMAYGAYGANDTTPEYPAHLGAWSMLYLGWAQSYRPTEDTLLTQGPIETGSPVTELWFQGESNPEHFLIENRQRIGFDRNLVKEGLILYHVDDSVIGFGLPGNRINAGANPGLRIVEADGQYDMVAGRNRGDVHDPFPGSYGRTDIDDDTDPSTRTFRDAVTQTALHQIAFSGTTAHYRVQVRAQGWQPQLIASPGGFDGPLPSSPANRAVQLADGSPVTVTSEMVAGRAQIMLRSRPRYGAWGTPLQVSSSAGSATEPTIATLPGGNDVVVAWADSRLGASQIYYRSRLGGAWTAERRITSLVGDSRSPSIGVDPSGRVHLAWLYTAGATPQVLFMSFGYFSPFGTPITVTDPTAYPDAPVVAVGPDGGSYVLWPDRAVDPATIWFARYLPDSGMSKRNLIAKNSDPEPAVDALVDPAGNLHVVFQVSGASVNQIHYQRRTPDGRIPVPFDTTIVSRSDAIQNPMVRADPLGNLHLAFTNNNAGVQQVRYKHYVTGRGWDFGATEVTRVSDGPWIRPTLLPQGPTDVSILSYGFPGGRTSLAENRRTEPTNAVAVHDVPRTGPPVLELGPNPLRAGTALALRWPPGPVPGRDAIEFYDVSGRRIAAVPLVAGARGSEAQLPGSVTAAWRSGVYFARVRNDAAPATRLVVLR